jgi:hypothetical protein
LSGLGFKTINRKGGRKNENQESMAIHIRVAHREIVRAARENSKGGYNQLSRSN